MEMLIKVSTLHIIIVCNAAQIFNQCTSSSYSKSSFYDVSYLLINFLIIVPFLWCWFSSYESFIFGVPLKLMIAKFLYKLLNRWVTHAKNALQSSVSCFGVIVCSVSKKCIIFSHHQHFWRGIRLPVKIMNNSFMHGPQTWWKHWIPPTIVSGTPNI